MPESDSAATSISVRVVVIVTVDPRDLQLLQLVERSNGGQSIADIVCDEIESNLQSVSYVNYVDAKYT